MNSRTALQRLAAEGGQLECWVTPGWKEQGIASIQVLGHAPGGRGAFAAFLVDLWAVGLKDAFGRSDVPWLDFREENILPWVEQSGAVKLDPKIARRLVAGGVRFGRQNAFRMPPGWEKFAVIFGRDILDEIPTADLSKFGVEGGLRYVGSMEFLQQRLAIPTAEFLARPDVQWIVQPDSGSGEPEFFDEFDDDEDEPDSERAEMLAEIARLTDLGGAQMAERVRAWCASQWTEPNPMLDEAARIIMLSIVPMAAIKDREPTDEELTTSTELVNLQLAQRPPTERKALSEAIEWLRECMAKIAQAKNADEETSAETSSAAADQALERARS